MLEDGALEECRALPRRRPRPRAAGGRVLGAPELFAHLDGDADARRRPSAAAVTATRQFAKRQRTWFRNRMPDWPRSIRRRRCAIPARPRATVSARMLPACRCERVATLRLRAPGTGCGRGRSSAPPARSRRRCGPRERTSLRSKSQARCAALVEAEADASRRARARRAPPRSRRAAPARPCPVSAEIAQHPRRAGRDLRAAPRPAPASSSVDLVPDLDHAGLRRLVDAELARGSRARSRPGSRSRGGRCRARAGSGRRRAPPRAWRGTRRRAGAAGRR